MKKVIPLLALVLITAFSTVSLQAEAGCGGCQGTKKEEPKKEEPKKEEPKKN